VTPLSQADVFFARQDDKPAGTCPFCNRSFARTDVLRKHLSRTCREAQAHGPEEVEEILETMDGERKRRRSSKPSISGLATVNISHEDRNPTPRPTYTSGSSSMMDVGNDVGPSTLPMPGMDARRSLDIGVNETVRDTGPPTQTGDHIDDLLTWLFNASPDTVSFDQTYNSSSSTSLLPSTSLGMDSTLVPPTIASMGWNGGGGGGDEWGIRMPARISDKAPRDVNPYAVPNEPVREAYGYEEDWGKGDWRMPEGREVVDDEAKMRMVGLFEVGVTQLGIKSC